MEGKQLSQIQAQIPSGFTESTIEYMMNVKSIDNLDELINQTQNLSDNVRGEAMTIAEALRAEGAEKAKKESETKIAINMLKNGMRIEDVAKYTELELAFIEKISKQQIEPTH